MNPIRTAIIGFGLAGKTFHAPLIRNVEALELTAVATSRVDEVPQGVRVGRAEDLAADPAVDLLVIASPNDTHFPLAAIALQSGKHVVVDKPFTVTADEAEQLIGIASAAPGLLTVFHNRRWDSDFKAVRRLFGSDALGEVKLYEAHWDRFRPEIPDRWREQAVPGAGLLCDLGPHLIDQALVLFGTPDAVQGDLAVQRDGALVDDYFDLTLFYGKRRVKLAAANLVAAPRPRFAIHGSKASFVKFGLDPQEDRAKAGGDPLDPGFGDEPEASWGTVIRPDGSTEKLPSETGDYLAFYRAVAEAIISGGPPPVDPADALAGLRIIELARRSAAEGRRLPFAQGS